MIPMGPQVYAKPMAEACDSSGFRGAWREYLLGRRFRVIRSGAYVWGLRSVAPWTRECVRIDLQMGTIITCLGRANTRGDGVPAVMWGDEAGVAYCEDPVFSPSITGSIWDERPDPSYIEPL